MSTDPNDLNLPFAEQSTTPIDLSDAQLSGGVVVMGAVVPAGGRMLPCVVFRFARPDGSGFWPPIVLACDRVADLEQLPKLAGDAVRAAVSRAVP